MPALRANVAIQKIGDAILGAEKDIYAAAKGGIRGQMNVTKAERLGIVERQDGKLKKTRDADWSDYTRALAMNNNGSYSAKRIAGMVGGGFVGASAAGRIVTGGGLYRDSDGEFDVIGIPIV